VVVVVVVFTLLLLLLFIVLIRCFVMPTVLIFDGEEALVTYPNPNPNDGSLSEMRQL